MAKQTEEPREVKCPIYEFIQTLCGKGKGKTASRVAEHLNNARMEVLMAVRSMIDARIDELKTEAKPSGRSRRIKVKEKE